MKKFIVVFLLILTTGCANKMKPTDFKDQKPRLSHRKLFIRQC